MATSTTRMSLQCILSLAATVAFASPQVARQVRIKQITTKTSGRPYIDNTNHGRQVLVINGRVYVRVNNTNVFRPRPLEEFLRFVRAHRAKWMDSMLAANPDGNIPAALSIARNVDQALGPSDLLRENHDANLLRGKAFELRFYALMTDVRAHPPATKSDARAKMNAIENAYRNALSYATRVADSGVIISANQRYGSLLDDIGRHERADACFQTAQSELSRFDDTEARRYIRLITFGMRTESDVAALAARMRKFLQGEGLFARAQHRRSLVLRGLESKESMASVERHWTAMMQDLDQSVEILRSINEPKHLAHVLQYRAVMILFNGASGKADLLRAAEDAHVASELLEVSRLRSDRTVRGTRPFAILWEELAACGSAEVQALLRLNQFPGEPSALVSERTATAKTIVRNLLASSPPDAALTTLSRLLNSLGTALMASEAPTNAAVANTARVSAAALAFAAADACANDTYQGLVYIESARSNIPATQKAAASARIGSFKSLGALRSFIATTEELDVPSVR